MFVQCEMRTYQNGAASRQIPAIKTHIHKQIRKSVIVMILIYYGRLTYFRNCGNNEVQPLVSCFSVKYNSKVETVFGSTLKAEIRLQQKSIQEYSKLNAIDKRTTYIRICAKKKRIYREEIAFWEIEDIAKEEDSMSITTHMSFSVEL